MEIEYFSKYRLLCNVYFLHKFKRDIKLKLQIKKKKLMFRFNLENIPEKANVLKIEIDKEHFLEFEYTFGIEQVDCFLLFSVFSKFDISE